MDNTAVWIMGIIVGLPVVGGLGYAAFEHLLNTKIKLQELRLKEVEARNQERLRADELNAKILRMDDLGVSLTEIGGLAEEVRQLRAEVSQLRQEITNRTVG